MAGFEACPSCGSRVPSGANGCGVCNADFGEQRRVDAAHAAVAGRLVLATTPTLGGNVDYLGVVFGEAILGTHMFEDLGAGVRDVVGGRARGYEDKLAAARESALEQLRLEAARLGADAVVGVNVDYASVKGTMLMVAAQGTAVRYRSVG